ncbi:MAG: T9SS type A sorting domain-containing protein [Flavobacteriales bacterium]|nr:T9SS type A sorting domain-containing protein [Flavobacteriales bacterium]
MRMLPRSLWTAALIAGVATGLFAQGTFFFDPNIPVTRQGTALPLAWAGGLNFVQVSTVDLDGDGHQDLFLFDRSGNVVVTLLNDGIPGQVSYRVTRDYDHIDPFPTLHDWALMRDYDCDGREDLFTYSNAGFAVYRNTSVSGTLSFELVSPLVYTDYVLGSGTVININLWVASVDIPGLVDVDGDGDLDILTFGLQGTNVQYHKNLSMELYGTCDSLAFELRNECWGFFAENFSDNGITLNAPCPFNVPNPEIVLGDQEAEGLPKAHAGSTVCPIDLNGDGVMDVLLGDITFNNLVALFNGGTVDLGNMTTTETFFPGNDVPVDLALFPAGYHIDLDNDGRRDLVVSPNATSLAQNAHSMWYYKNNGTEAAPQFNFQQNNVLQDRMLDFGEGAYPVPFDHDGDGLMDLVVANHGYFNPNGPYVGKLALLRNTGTATAPAFELVSDDYMGLSTSGIGLSMYPAFGDVDGDGDLDMYIGDLQGRIHFYRNVSTGPVAQFQLEQPNMTDAFGEIIDVGQFAAPQLIDMDDDGLLDLVVGERNGNLNLYQNTGTAEAPQFTLSTENLGGVSTVDSWNFPGHSIPFVHRNEDGDREIVLGSESGWLFRYGDIDDNLMGEWTRLDTAWLDLRDGQRTGLCLYDFTGDGKLDLVLGNYRGGLSFWRSDDITGTGGPNANLLPAFQVAPNPAAQEVFLTLHSDPAPGSSWLVLDAMGREVMRARPQGLRTVLDVQGFSAGIYLVRLEGPAPTPGQRLVVGGR